MKIFFSIFLLTFSQFLGAQNGSPKVEIKNLGPHVNSSFSDFAPLISADGSTMVFTSLRPADKTSSSPNAAAKKDVQKIKDANSAIFITYYDEKSKTWIEPIMLESVVNLAGVDNSAIALSNDGQRMLLYRSGNNKNINKGVFETTLKGNEWSVPKRLLAPINSDGNETSASFSPDGKIIYFVSSRLEGLGGRDIWYCIQNEAGDWGEAVNIGNLINTKEDEESVFLHPNGSSLFFSSKGHNSTGGYDVFVSHLDTVTNIWAKPINLGSPINTPGDDLYFVMAANEKTAYYASSKAKVVGNKDIYSITLPESILSKHITLVKGFVIGENGLGIESKIVVKEKLTGDIINTFKSNKATGKFLVSLPATGEYQINFTDDNNGTYTEFIEASEKNNYNEVVLNIVLEPKYANIFCRVLNEEGDPIPKVQIELIDIITNQLIGKFETNSAGGSRFSLPFETKFNIVFSKPGYLFQSVNVSIPKSSGSESKDIKDITLQKVEVGKKITINNVFFDFNQEIPQQQSFADLDRIIKLMNDMNSLQVEISGHTDNVGFQDNKKLSEQKAKAVMNYLVGKGCEKSRLKYKGYGSTDPIATNETEEGRQINSRIELKVLKVDLIAEQIAEEKRIQSGSDNVKVDDVISPYPIINEEEQISENKDSILAANKKDENFDAIKEAFGEDESQENKDSTLTTLKKDESTTDTPVVVEEEKVQENEETIIAEVKKEETTTDTPLVIEEEKIQENKETVVAEVKKEETTTDTPVVVEEEKVQESKETVVAEVKKEETTADTTILVEEEKVQEIKETVVADVKKEEITADTPIVVEEEKVQENKETIVAEVKKEETTVDTPIVVEEEKIQENKETIVAEVKKEETTEDPSKELLLKENQELAKKIDAMEQKYKASLDSVVNASWGAEGTPVVEEQGINADSSNQEYSQEQADTTVVAEYANEENTSASEENGEQTEIIADENADSAEDSLSMEIKNIGSLVNSPFPDYAPLIHADGNVMIFSTNRPLNETATTVTPPVKKGKPQTLENKGGKSNIYTSYYDLKDKKWFAPRKLGPTINLPDVNNSAIALSNDGQKMILYRYDGNQLENGDLFESSLNGEEWSTPLRLPASINSNDNETSASISPDGKTIYFVSNRKLGVGEKDIWYSTQESTGIWGQAVNIGESINTDKDEESVFIHPNGNTIFFSSKGHNSMGGYDIFMSDLDSATGEWGTPKNLGRSINTTEDDMYFTLAANGKKGYYASSKPNGIGENDIYSVVLGSNIIKKNTTLVKGFITDENGEGIKSKIEIIDKSTDEVFGIFNSNRITGKYLVSLPTGKKYDLKITADGYTAYVVSLDISFKTGYNEIVKNIVLETKNVFITSRMFNETGKPISVLIEAIDNASLQLIDKSESDNEGYSKIAVPSGKELAIFFSKPGYLFQSVNLSIPKSTEFESKDLKNITMQKVGVGKKTVLKTISFDFNQTIPRQESFLDLDRIVTLMNDVASAQIEISGHTDNVGSKKDNSKLSNERAKALVDLLITKGIDKKRLEYKGYGSNEPISSNDTESGRKANNRTELKVLKVDLKAEELAEEKRIKEMPIANIVSLKPDETIVSVDEKQAEENKDTVAIADKKDENNDAPIQTGEEKTQENKETIVTDVKKDENTNDAPVVIDEEKIQENKETEIAIDKKDENIDSPTETGEEKLQENKEIIVADKKEESDTPVETGEEKAQQTNETMIADKKESNNSGNFSRHMLETYSAEKKEENTNDTPVVTKEEKIQENKETVIADVKKDENTNDTPVVTEEENIQENKETVVADVKKDDAEQKNQARLDSIVNASWGSNPDEQVQENKETELSTDNKDENTNDTPVVTEEEKIQENKETMVADKESSDTPVEAGEENAQENNETIVADKKETNNSGNFSRHMLESYSTDKKEENTKSNKVEIIHEKQEPLDVVADKKEETADPTDVVQSEETKEATLAVNENDDANAATKETTEATKSNNTSTLPERYKEFDKDVNGTITYDEIIKMIDSFFDDAPNVKQEDITSIIDYFFSD